MAFNKQFVFHELRVLMQGDNPLKLK